MADWMKPAPHQWEMIPRTRTETKGELNVRESRHTVMLWPKKYYDIDTGKFDTDRIETIFSQSINELWNCRSFSDHTFDGYRAERSREYPDAWFVPKDDDFDREEELLRKKKEEERKEQERKKQAIERQKAAEELSRYAEERLRQHNIEMQRRLEEEEYRKKVRETEERAKEFREMERFNQGREKQMEKWQSRSNIRPNSWRPK